MSERVRRFLAVAIVVTTLDISLFIMLSHDAVASPLGEILVLCGPISCILLAVAPIWLTRSETIIAMLGGGLSLSIVGGVALALTPFGLDRTSGAAWILAVSTAAATVWWWRGLPVPSVRARHQPPGPVTAWSVVLLLTAAIIAVGASLVAIEGDRFDAARPVLEAWVLPGTGSGGGAPPYLIGLREVAGGQATCTVDVGDSRGAYFIWHEINLDDGLTWLGRLEDPPSGASGSLEIQVSCMTGSGESIARTLRIGIDDA